MNANLITLSSHPETPFPDPLPSKHDAIIRSTLTSADSVRWWRSANSSTGDGGKKSQKEEVHVFIGLWSLVLGARSDHTLTRATLPELVFPPVLLCVSLTTGIKVPWIQAEMLSGESDARREMRW